MECYGMVDVFSFVGSRLFFFLLSFSSFADMERRLKHPELMSDAAGCSNWVGTLEGGNDSTARIQFQICPNGEKITGRMQWSSLVSGWSVRSISGTRDATGNTLILRDTAMLEAKPELGWSFCLVDQYDCQVISFAFLKRIQQISRARLHRLQTPCNLKEPCHSPFTAFIE